MTVPIHHGDALLAHAHAHEGKGACEGWRHQVGFGAVSNRLWVRRSTGWDHGTF